MVTRSTPTTSSTTSPLVRQERVRQLHGGAGVATLIDEKTGKARDRRHHQGRRSHRQVGPQRLGHFDHPHLTDYPALLVHRNFDADGADPIGKPIGTGAFELVSYDVGEKAVVKRRENGKWWGGEALLDGCRVHRLRHRFLNALVNAFESGEVDVNKETGADYRRLSSMGSV